jgi:CRISPR system Cascade subunit CasD
MATLLLRLVGPMQSWGTTSRFDERDTGSEPSKSGVLGLLAAALGIDRSNWTDLEPLTHLALAIRHDRPGTPARDYQTAACARTDKIIRADGSQAKEKDGGVVSTRHYLADAAFLAGLEGPDRGLLERLLGGLQNPVWPLALGRKSYVPAEPLWLPNHLRPIQNAPLIEVMVGQPWIGARRKWETLPTSLRLSSESVDGSGTMRMDQPLSSFAERRFGARFVHSDWVPFPGEVTNVPA